MPADVRTLLSGLDPEQRSAVEHPSKLLAIVAPAGSGKTRTLTHRIAYRVATGTADAQRVLAVTFTRKAAGELRQRLSGPLGCEKVAAGTFHALALGQLRRRESDAGRSVPALLESKFRVLAPIIGGRGEKAALAVTEVAGEIEWAKARALGPDDYVEAALRSERPLPRPAEEIANFYRRYETDKRRRNVIDFEDTIWWCADLLERDADFAAAVRFRHRHLFVDEFQDVTPLQLRLLRGWVGNRFDLTVVGDEAQSIYAFTGAQTGILSGFDRIFPGAVTVHLATNYRSTPEIVTVADAVLDAASGVRRPTPRAPRESGPAPLVRSYPDATAEATAVAAAAKRIHDRGVPWNEIAVLYRINAQSAEFESALRSAGVPFRMRSAVAFTKRPEVRIVLDELQQAEQAAPGRPLADLLADLDSTPPADDASEISETSLREHREAVAALAHEFLALEGTRVGVRAFIAWMDTTTRGDDPLASGDGIELSTFHAAKGLEWEHVFVTGVEQGLVPISHARTPAARAEEQRLLHVALSRAGSELQVSWAEQRNRPRKPSPWLELVEAAAAGRRVAELRPAPDRRSELSKTAATLRAAGGAASNRALLEALKDWRANLARATGVPHYAIFSNATLDAIAVAQPSTPGELLACPGVGDAKLARWGDEILAIVARHPAPASARHTAATRPGTPGSSAPARPEAPGRSGVERPGDADLVAELKAWRRSTALAADVPPYRVFPDSTIAGIVAARPSTPNELLACNGIGPAKLDAYGAAVLEIVARHH